MSLSSSALVAVADVGDGCDVLCAQPLSFAHVFVQSGTEKKSQPVICKNSRIHRIHSLSENATFATFYHHTKQHTMHQSQSAGSRGVCTFRVVTYLGCRSCRWSRGGTCTCWAPHTRRACSQADTELLGKDSKEDEGDQHWYQNKVTKHSLPLILDLAVNNLVYHMLE